MTIFDKHIKIRKLLNVRVLSTRATARELMNRINTLKKTIVFDFDEIDFASRSFIDELNALIKENENKKFKLVNMNEQVERMNDLVRNPIIRETRSKKTSKSQDADLVTI